MNKFKFVKESVFFVQSVDPKEKDLSKTVRFVTNSSEAIVSFVEEHPDYITNVGRIDSLIPVLTMPSDEEV